MIKMKKINSSALAFAVLLIVVAVFGFIQSAWGWTNPSANPPSGGGALYYSGGNVGIRTTNPTAPLEVKGGWPAVLVSGDSSPTLRVAGPGSTYKHIELKDTGNGEVWQFSHRPQSEQNRLDIWAFKENSGFLTNVRRLVSMDRNYGVGIGYLPNDIPSGWGGGLVTWDVIAKASVRANKICLGGSLGGNDIGDCRTSWGGGINITRVSNSSNEAISLTATCPSGTRVVGGGCRMNSSPVGHNSYPSSDTAWTCNWSGWVAGTAYAICAQ